MNIFSDLNQKMEQTGTFTMKRSALFRVVATANTTLADVILRLGLLERLFLNFAKIEIETYSLVNNSKKYGL